MAKHTEGSWRVEWSTDRSGDPCFTVLKNDGDAGDDGRMVDASYSIIEMAYGVLENDENEANANLIAAAPDLYAACQSALHWWESLMARTPDGREAARSLRMALAYARGEDYRFDDDEQWGEDTATQQLERGPR